MRVKSNKALRRSARLARRAPMSAVAALPAQASILRRPGLTHDLDTPDEYRRYAKERAAGAMA